MKIYFFIIAIVMNTNLHAQSASDIINSEKSFARMALDSGLRSAFLNYLDSTGVTFNGGEIYNGIRQYSSLKEPDFKLLWTPAFAALSASDDIGFTTGPYEVKKTMDSPIIASGQYSTIWMKNSTGKWKVLVDLGTEYSPSLFDSTLAPVTFSRLTTATDSLDYQMLDAAFIKSYKEKRTANFQLFISDGTWFNLQQHHPFTTVTAVVNANKNIPDNLIFSPVAGAMSAARDLAFMYGTVILGEKKENYLRVWGHTKGGWMLLLHTLKW